MSLSTPSMKRCPDCDAPNPASRRDCYACGGALNGPPSPPRESVTLRSPAAPSPSGLAAPEGWTAEALPDGTVLLRRIRWRLLLRDRDWMWPTALGATLLAARLTGSPRKAAAGTLGWLLPVLILLIGVTWVLVTLCAREELRAGPGYLEKRWRLCGWRLGFRLAAKGGLLRIETGTHALPRGAGYYTRRTLRVALGAREHRLDARSHGHGLSGMLLGPWGGRDTVGRGDDVAHLGWVLAERTGWPLREDAER